MNNLTILDLPQNKFIKNLKCIGSFRIHHDTILTSKDIQSKIDKLEDSLIYYNKTLNDHKTLLKMILDKEKVIIPYYCCYFTKPLRLYPSD